MGLFNSTCPLSKAEIDRPNFEKPIVGSVKFQELMLYISGPCTIITIGISFTLMVKHLLCYCRPREQRQIIRIAFLPPLYSIMSFFTIYSYPDSLYLKPAQDLYEPVALASLFFLYTEFAAPDPATRETYFAELENRRKIGGRFSKKYEAVPGGSLRWFQSKWVAIYFYFVASVGIKIVEEITQAAGRYCSSSFSPEYAHIWVMVISNLALPVGVVAVIQFYQRLKIEPDFQAHRPLQKLLSFKAVIAINFLQDIIFEILTGTHTFKGSSTVTYKDLSIGLPNLLITVEQIFIAAWYHWSFSTREYRTPSKTSFLQPQMNIFSAALSALNPSDLFLGSVYAAKLLWSGIGPKGNGSWRKNGGYDKLSEQQYHQKQESVNLPTYESSFAYQNAARLSDEEQQHHVTAQHGLLQTPQLAALQTYQNATARGSGDEEEEEQQQHATSQHGLLPPQPSAPQTYQ